MTDNPPDPAAAPLADEAFLIDYLKHCDAACPMCGYDLRLLATPRCPECGETLKLGVGLSQPHMRAWVALAVPLIAAAGMGLFFIVLAVGRGTLPPPQRYPFMRYALAYFWAAIPIAVVAVLRRRTILQMDVPMQRRRAALAWALLVAALTLTFIRR